MTDKPEWLTEKYAISPYNFIDKLGADSYFPRKVLMYDVTLRDGEQTPGIVLRKDDKVKIAQALNELGVSRIEAGFPITSPEDKQAVKEIAHLGLSAETWVLSRCVKDDIDVALECDVEGVICEISTSALKIKAYGFNEEMVTDRILETITYAKEQGLKAAFFAVDATRTEIDYLKKVYRIATREAHADEVVVVDTLGVALPEAIYYLTRAVKEWVPVPVHIHCHNDFGLATACTLAGVKAGAEYVHSTINGIGEKAGNTDTAEIALSLELLCGVDTGLRLESLCQVSKLVEELSGFKISSNKPVVGENVFRRESGLAVQQLVHYPPAVESFTPELVGGKREIVFGKKSGKYSIKWKLEHMKLEASKEQIAVILNELKSESEKRKRLVSDEELERIIRRVIKTAPQKS